MYIDFLLEVFKEFYNNEYIIYNGEKYNYRFLIESLENNKIFIGSHQIKQGTVVALEGDFTPNSIALLLALIEKACIIVPLTSASNKNEKKLFDIAQVEFVFRIDEKDEITSEYVSQKSDNNYYKIIREKKTPRLNSFYFWYIR